MKKTLLAVAVMSATLGSLSVSAADGTINFTGEVIETGCRLDSANNSQTVTLPKVAKSTFAGVNSTSGRTPFTIKLMDCPSNTAGNIKFEGTVVGGTQDTLANGGSAGLGIGIQLIKPNSTDLVTFNTKDGAGSFLASDLNGDKIELTYTAQYVAKDLSAITAGAVSSAVTLEISY
jgi:major type 1 subunit fimbrin (pilin)